MVILMWLCLQVQVELCRLCHSCLLGALRHLKMWRHLMPLWKRDARCVTVVEEPDISSGTVALEDVAVAVVVVWAAVVDEELQRTELRRLLMVLHQQPVAVVDKGEHAGWVLVLIVLDSDTLRAIVVCPARVVVVELLLLFVRPMLKCWHRWRLLLRLIHWPRGS